MSENVWGYAGNVRGKIGKVPLKFLNMYDFGMKMYTSQPITASVFVKHKYPYAYLVLQRKNS